MQSPKKPVIYMLAVTFLVLLAFLIMQPLQLLYFGKEISVIYPKGQIAWEERHLLLFSQGVMLLVVIPVYILTFIFSWRYRADNTKAKYDPELIDHLVAEIIWWGIPLLVVVVLGTVTWFKTYELDPFKPIVSDKKELKIQVVALQWKWLFIYPEEKIATVNFFQFPKETPLHFEITADAPMNSFWIPDLGGQIYAMPGMKTELYLIADASGEFRGSSANISGEGFADMHFIAKASSDEEFQNWIDSIKDSSNTLDFEAYQKLAAPSRNTEVELYTLKDETLLYQVIMKFMAPPKNLKSL
ncbi:MAG: ubiquinol oxidase subunit II [Parachlamydiaceae bacterium]|nr:ubiquinol oxidase subunit II [Parachlamydiaceae bacterium]